MMQWQIKASYYILETAWMKKETVIANMTLILYHC